MQLSEKLYNNSVLLKILAVLVFIVVGFLIYSNIYGNKFVFDDINNIRENPQVALKTLSFENLKKTVSGGRPFATLTFALNYYCHGYKVWGYHFVNILIHILNAIVLFFLFSGILDLIAHKGRGKSPGLNENNKNNNIIISFIASIFWFVNPVQTQSVTYTVQRMNSLSSLFFITSLLFYINGRRAEKSFLSLVCFVLCSLSFVLAIASKENAVMLPFFILMIELYFLKGLKKEWIKKYAKYLIGVFCVFLFVLLVWIGKGRFDLIMTGYENYDFNMSQRLLTESRVLVVYLTLLVFPHPGRLHLDYNFPISYSLFDPFTTLLSIITIFSLLFYAIACFKKESFCYSENKILSFAIIWYFGNLFIESSFIPIELVYEHRLYLPSMFLFLSLTVFLFDFAKRKYLIVSVFLMISVLFSFWTYKRNFIWKDRIIVWQDNIAKIAPKARSYSNFGTALMNEKRYEEAIIQLKKAIELNPGHYPSHNNLGYALFKQGKYLSSIEHFKDAVKIKNDYPIAYQNWGDALEQLNSFDEAIKKYEKSLFFKPDSVLVLNRIAMVYALKKDYEKAAFYFEKIHTLQPLKAKICYNIACMYSLADNKTEAVKWLKKAISLGYNKMDKIRNDKDLFNIRKTNYYLFLGADK